MTDPEIADATYIEPLTPKSMEAIIAQEKPDAMQPTVGGQTGLNLALALSENGVLDKFGVMLIGANLSAIKAAEDRMLFRETMLKAGIPIPRGGPVHSLAEAEQLIAESTGKDEMGILPIEGESLESPEFYGEDRIFVYTHFKDDSTYSSHVDQLKVNGHPIIEIILDDIYELGGEFFRWEFATAVAGWKLGIQPFDQPNVESAKIEAKAMINSYLKKGELPRLGAGIEENGISLFGETTTSQIKDSLTMFLDLLNDSNKYNYVGIMAYITPTNEIEGPLQEFRTKIQKKYRVAVTTGYGPRFLHSTGQLHKGDAGKGLFIQITESIKKDVNIPKEPGSEEFEFTFGVLKTSQLLGDRQALLNNKRKVVTIDLGNHTVDNLNKITKLI